MARVYKCDHCGKCYDSQDFPGDSFLHIEKGYVAKGIDLTDPPKMLTLYKTEENVIELSHLDFCQDCTQKILKMITKQEVNENAENLEKACKLYFSPDMDNLDDIINEVRKRYGYGGNG